jgi:hypothetical protein
MAWSTPAWLLVEGHLRPIRLPYQARYPRRITRYMEPARIASPIEGYAWLVCGIACSICVVRGRSYRVIVAKRRVTDSLSSLRHVIVAEVSGIIDEKTVWRALWTGEMLRVSNIECEARVLGDGTVLCDSGRCHGPECLLKCLEGGSG